MRDLVATVAGLTRSIEGEGPATPPPAPPRESVLTDQLAVVTYDLQLALDTTPDQAAADAAIAAYRQTADEVDPR